MSNAGAPITGQLKWNDNKDAVAFYSDDVLPPHASIKALVQVSFEELAGITWRPMMDNGQKAVETEEVTFTTGDAPDNIPMSNVQYTYPVVDQQYFFPGEYNQGYIQLKRGQPYLFDQSKGWKQELHLRTESGQDINPGFSYDTENKRLAWGVPALGSLVKYSLQVVNLPPASSAQQQVQQTYTAANTGDATGEGGETSILNNQAGTALTNTGTGEKMILTYNFATSQYNTFAQKLNAVNITQIIREPIYLPDVHALQVFTSYMEAFDAKELSGSEFTEGKPMINAEAILEGDAYYEKTIRPLIYDNYPYDGMARLTRQANQSLVPTWAVYPIDYYSQYANTRLPYRYHLPMQYKTDLLEIQKQLLERSLPYGVPDKYQPVVNSLFPVIEPGTYKMKLTYMMPGQRTGSSAVISMYNFIR